MDVTPEQVIALYQGGDSIETIARTTGWPRSRVHRALTAAGVTMRPNHPASTPAPPRQPRTRTNPEQDARIIQLVADGRTNPEIAAELWLDVETIKSHLRRLFRKHGANNRAHLVTLTRPTGKEAS